MDEAFLKDAIMERLNDDSPAVVAAALKLLEVSETIVNRIDDVWFDGGVELFLLFQAVFDTLDREDTFSSLLSLLHRADQSAAEQWSVKLHYTGAC